MAAIGGASCEMFNDDKPGCVSGMAGSDGGSRGGRFLGWAGILIGTNAGLTALVVGVGNNVR